MKKRKAIIIGALSLLALAGGAASAPAIGARAEGEGTSLVSEEPTSEEAPAESEGESSKKNYLEDKDGDGIPDAINDYYNEHIRDQYMFGITLGSVIAFAVSFFGWLLTYMKYRKMGKDIHEAMALTSGNAKETAENFRKMAESSETLQASLSDTAAKMVEYAEGVKKEATEYKAAYEEKSEEMKEEYAARSAELLAKVSEAEAKIGEYKAQAESLEEKYEEMAEHDRALAKAINELAHTEEYVKNGVADSVESITKGVRDDG